MSSGLLNRTDRQEEYEGSFENLWQSFRSMYKYFMDLYNSTTDKEEKAKQLYVLKQLSKIDTCRKLNNVFIGKGIVKDWDFAPARYKQKLTDQQDIENVKKLTKPYFSTQIQNDLNDFKSVVERYIQQASIKKEDAKMIRMLADKDDDQKQMLDDIIQKSKNNNNVLFDEIKKQKNFQIDAQKRAIEIKTDMQYDEQDELLQVVDKHKEMVNDGIQKIQTFSTNFENNIVGFVKNYKNMNKEETQKKIASVFKKYDYYITDLINSKNPNITKASGKFGGNDGDGKENTDRLYQHYTTLLYQLLVPESDPKKDDISQEDKRELLFIMSPMFVSEKFKNKGEITDDLLQNNKIDEEKEDLTRVLNGDFAVKDTISEKEKNDIYNKLQQIYSNKYMDAHNQTQNKSDYVAQQMYQAYSYMQDKKVDSGTNGQQQNDEAETESIDSKNPKSANNGKEQNETIDITFDTEKVEKPASKEKPASNGTIDITFDSMGFLLDPQDNDFKDSITVKNVKEYMNGLMMYYKEIASMYLETDKNNQYQPFIECINIISKISGIDISAQDFMTQLILPGALVDKIKLQFNPTKLKDGYYSFNLLLERKADKTIIDNIVENIINAMFAVVQIFMNKYSQNKPTLQDIIISGGDKISNSQPIKGAEMFYQLFFILVKDIIKQVDGKQENKNNSILRLYIPQTNKFAEVYQFIEKHPNQSVYTQDTFNSYVELCNDLWNTANGETDNNKINQRTYNILREFINVVMQNIVIHTDETGPQNQAVDNITELIEDGIDKNKNDGTDYMMLDTDTSITQKKITTDDLLTPFNKSYVVKKSFNQQYNNFLNIVKNLMTNITTINDLIVNIAKIIYNSITSTQVIGANIKQQLSQKINEQCRQLLQSKTNQIDIKNDKLQDKLKNIVDSKYIRFDRDMSINIDNQFKKDIIYVDNSVADLYNTPIEDKEKKLDFVINMIFYNGTNFMTANNSEDIKKEFDLYIKNYISQPEYKNINTYSAYVLKMFKDFSTVIVYKLFNNKFMLEAGFQQIYLESYLTLIYNIQYWYHKTYIDPIINKDFIMYLIKYTHFNTDPIITRWASKKIKPGKNDVFSYELTKSNVTNINMLLAKYIPLFVRTTTDQLYNITDNDNKNNTNELKNYINDYDNNINKSIKENIINLFLQKHKKEDKYPSYMKRKQDGKDLNDSILMQYYELIKFGADQFYNQYQFMLDINNLRRWCLRDMLQNITDYADIFFDENNQLTDFGQQMFFAYDYNKQQSLGKLYYKRGDKVYFANSTYEQYLQQGIYPDKVYIVDDDKVRLEKIIPGVTVTDNKYDCTQLINELKTVKSKINYNNFATNEQYYRYFQIQIDTTYDSAIELVKQIFDLKLPVIESYEDFKTKLSGLRYQGPGLILMKRNNNVMNKQFDQRQMLEVANSGLLSGKENVKYTSKSIQVNKINSTNYQDSKQISDIEQLNNFITNVVVGMFGINEKMPESIAQKIVETPYIKDMVLTSQKIVNKDDQNIIVYDNVIQTPFQLSGILFNNNEPIDLSDFDNGDDGGNGDNGDDGGDESITNIFKKYKKKVDEKKADKEDMQDEEGDGDNGDNGDYDNIPIHNILKPDIKKTDIMKADKNRQKMYLRTAIQAIRKKRQQNQAERDQIFLDAWEQRMEDENGQQDDDLRVVDEPLNANALWIAERERQAALEQERQANLDAYEQRIQDNQGFQFDDENDWRIIDDNAADQNRQRMQQRIPFNALRNIRQQRQNAALQEMAWQNRQREIARQQEDHEFDYLIPYYDPEEEQRRQRQEEEQNRLQEQLWQRRLGIHQRRVNRNQNIRQQQQINRLRLQDDRERLENRLQQQYYEQIADGQIRDAARDLWRDFLGHGRYNINGGNAFINNFSLPPNVFLLDFVTVLRSVYQNSTQQQLKQIVNKLSFSGGTVGKYWNYSNTYQLNKKLLKLINIMDLDNIYISLIQKDNKSLEKYRIKSIVEDIETRKTFLQKLNKSPEAYNIKMDRKKDDISEVIDIAHICEIQQLYRPLWAYQLFIKNLPNNNYDEVTQNAMKIYLAIVFVLYMSGKQNIFNQKVCFDFCQYINDESKKEQFYSAFSNAIIYIGLFYYIDIDTKTKNKFYDFIGKSMDLSSFEKFKEYFKISDKQNEEFYNQWYYRLSITDYLIKTIKQKICNGKLLSDLQDQLLDAEISYRLNQSYSHNIANPQINFELVKMRISQIINEINKFQVTKFYIEIDEYLDKFFNMCQELASFFEKSLFISVTMDTIPDDDIPDMCWAQERNENGKAEIEVIKQKLDSVKDNKDAYNDLIRNELLPQTYFVIGLSLLINYYIARCDKTVNITIDEFIENEENSQSDTSAPQQKASPVQQPESSAPQSAQSDPQQKTPLIKAAPIKIKTILNEKDEKKQNKITPQKLILDLYDYNRQILSPYYSITKIYKKALSTYGLKEENITNEYQQAVICLQYLLHAGWFVGQAPDLIFIYVDPIKGTITPVQWKYNGTGKRHIPQQRVGGAYEMERPNYNKIVTEMKLPQVRKQILEQTSQVFYYNRMYQKIERLTSKTYQEPFNFERILYLYNLNALQNTIGYEYTLDDKIRICSEIIAHNQDIINIKTLIRETENKYIQEVGQNLIQIITNFLNQNIRYIFDKNEIKKEYDEFTNKYTTYNLQDMLTLLLKPQKVFTTEKYIENNIAATTPTLTRMYLFIMMRSYYTLSQKLSEQYKPSIIQDNLFENIYNMQQFYINVLNSKYTSFSESFQQYNPEKQSFRMARLLFVRKSHKKDTNIIGTDHGYTEYNKNNSTDLNKYCKLVRVAYVEDPYRERVGGQIDKYKWLDGENYKNTYYNQLLNGIGGQINLTAALQEKTKYALLGLASPLGNNNYGPLTKLDMIIKNLKDKNGLSTNKQFNDIFTMRVNNSDENNVNILNINNDNEVSFNLKNIDLYGTNYGIPVATHITKDKETGEEKLLPNYLAPLTIAQSIQVFSGITEPAIVKAAMPICLSIDTFGKSKNLQTAFNTYLSILNDSILIEDKIKITDKENEYAKQPTTNLIFKLTGIQPINAISLISNNISLPVTTILSMYNNKFFTNTAANGSTLSPTNIQERTAQNLINLRNMVRAYMRDNRKVTLEGPFLHHSLLTSQMAEPYNDID